MAHTTFLQGTDTRYEPSSYQAHTGVLHRHESLSLMYAYHARHIQELYASYAEIYTSHELTEAIKQEDAGDFNENETRNASGGTCARGA